MKRLTLEISIEMDVPEDKVLDTLSGAPEIWQEAIADIAENDVGHAKFVGLRAILTDGPEPLLHGRYLRHPQDPTINTESLTIASPEQMADLGYKEGTS